MADRRASESVDFVSAVVKFKCSEDPSRAKDNAARIYAKFIAPESFAQVCLPTDIIEAINQGMQPKFPSDMLFDQAVEHITSFLHQDLWQTFKQEESYRANAPILQSSLGLGNTSPLLLCVRWLGCTVRHVILLTKRIVTIGASHCDILTLEAGSAHTTVLSIKLVSGTPSATVCILWNATPKKRDSRSSALTGTSVQTYETAKSKVVARYMPQTIRFEEMFTVGDYEVMITPLHA